MAKSRTDRNTFEVSVIEVDKRSTPDDPFGGESTTACTVHSKRMAFVEAIKRSLLAEFGGCPVHETMVKEWDLEGECVGHWYFQKGKMTWDMMN